MGKSGKGKLAVASTHPVAPARVVLCFAVVQQRPASACMPDAEGLREQCSHSSHTMMQFSYWCVCLGVVIPVCVCCTARVLIRLQNACMCGLLRTRVNAAHAYWLLEDLHGR
eukprot:1005599-Pelagomonas_calceolata.AAC.2